MSQQITTAEMTTSEMTTSELTTGVVATPSTVSIAAVSRLTDRVASSGIDADRLQLLNLAHDARDLGVSSVLIDVMVDEQAPIVARLRAYGRVSARACALSPAGRPEAQHGVLVSA
ncbi:MAG: hypothetical protein ACKOE2_01460 [Actinomycetales bacterium]